MRPEPPPVIPPGKPPLPRATPARLFAGLVLLAAGAATLRAAPAAFDPAAETARLLATLPAEARARSDAYFEGGYWLQLWEVGVTFVLMGLLYRSRVVVGLRDLAERWVRWRFLTRFGQGLLFFGLYLLLVGIIRLPWEYYTGFIREHHYGLSNLTPGGWLREQALGLIPGLALGAPVGALLYLGLRRYPTRWWVAAGVATPLLLTLLLVIAPVFIAPLFNRYTPLRDAAIRDPILSLARANGVPVDHVYEFDASRQTSRISANVSGAFHTIRVSLNDNLLRRCSPAEIQAVMAHELGHYVLNHVTKLTIYFSLVALCGFAFVHGFFGAMHRRFGAAWGVRDIGDFAGLPLFGAAFSLFLLLATPVTNSIVRTTETEADLFGLNAARQPDGFATTALKLAEYRKLAPGPWEEFLFFDHPSGRSRIRMAMQWKAEHLAEVAPAAAPGR